MDLNRYQGLIFDLDGTLVDLNVNWKKVKRHDYENREQEECRMDKWIPNLDLIGYINSSNQPFAIYSMNSMECINNFIQKYLDRIPVIIVSIDNCEEPKPTNLDLIKITRAMNLDPWNILFIGDSGYDERSGEMANIKTLII